MPILLLCLAFSFLIRLGVLGALINVTIDDADESITYDSSPAGLWKQGNGDCPGCNAQPDPSLMHSGTWHDTTAVPPNFPGLPPTGSMSISFTFSGIAIYAFCALHTFTDMQFLIDGNMVDQFSQTADDYQYNVPVFAKGGLSPGQHTFTLLNTPGDPTKLSLVLFDYLVYTREDSQAQVSSNNNPPPPISTDTSQPIQSESTSQSSGATSTTGSLVSTATTGRSNINSGPSNNTNLSSTIAQTFGSVTITHMQAVSQSSSPTGVLSKTSPIPQATANANRKSQSSLTKIVLISVGGTVLLLIFAAGLWIYRRRKRAGAAPREKTNSPRFIQPYNPSAEGLIHPPADEKRYYGIVADTMKASHHSHGPGSSSSGKGRTTGPSSSQLHRHQRTLDARMDSHSIAEIVSEELANSTHLSQHDPTRSSPVILQPPRPNQRAVDAGRLSIHSPDEDEDSELNQLPPDYHEVFTESSSH